MPPTPDGLRPAHIAIVVVVVLAGSVLMITAVTLLLRRRKRRNHVQYLNPRMRGGGDYDQEVVEYMKSSSFDGEMNGGFQLESSSQPYELGYTSRSWRNVPRTLQPGQSNTALPEYRPITTNVSKVEVEDTSTMELPPDKSNQRMRPGPKNFSWPSRNSTRLTCDTKADEKRDDILEDGPAGMLKNATAKPTDLYRVSSPTVPGQRINTDGRVSDCDPRPVSPLSQSFSLHAR